MGFFFFSGVSRTAPREGQIGLRHYHKEIWPLYYPHVLHKHLLLDNEQLKLEERLTKFKL